jgi:hypothetical protein
MQFSFRLRRFVRVAALVLAAVLVLGAAAWFFGLPLEAHYLARRVPVLRQTPVPIGDLSFTASAGRTLDFCGCGFDVPWGDLNDAKTKTGPNSRILYFDSGLVALLKCEPPREFVEGVLSSIKVSPADFRRAFGQGPVESDYALTRLMLETTPMSFRTPPRQQGPLMSLLILKAMATPPADSGIFAIHSDEFDGFQYQDPKARPDSVLMNLFAEDRSLEFQFLLKYHGASPGVSQADINRIARTIHKVAPYPSIKRASLTQHVK